MEPPSFPDVGEIVVVTVRKITQFGAYLSLDEYNNMEGFLHISEISTGLIKNIDRYIKENQKLPLKVIRVNRAKGEIDLSLKQLTNEERKAKLMELKKAKKAESIFSMVKAKLGLSSDAQQLRVIEDNFEGLHVALMKLIKDGPTAWISIGVDQPYAEAAYEIAMERIKPSLVEVDTIMEVSSSKPNGMEVVKKALLNTQGQIGKNNLLIKYLGAPKYKVVAYGDNYKEAEKRLNRALAIMEKEIKGNGQVKFITK